MTEIKGDIFFDLLLVEDNEADFILLREAMEELNFAVHLHGVQDGEEAMKYLRRQAPYTEAVRPDLIFLDINMPKINGFGVLADIKRDKYLQGIPVIVLSTSQAEEDISRSYSLQANCYISKPSSLDEFLSVIKLIGKFWLGTAKLPKHKTIL